MISFSGKGLSELGCSDSSAQRQNRIVVMHEAFQQTSSFASVLLLVGKATHSGNVYIKCVVSKTWCCVQSAYQSL